MVPLRLSQGPFRGPFIGQGPLVEVSPDLTVQAPISIELGALPLSIGLLAASGVSFLVKGELPKGWPRGAATIAGVGLALAGAVNLFLPKEAAPPVPGGYRPAQATAFDNVVGRIEQPRETATVDISPFASSYPVRVAVHNPSTEPVTFELVLEARERPSPTGTEVLSSLPVQVALGPNQARDIDVAMPIGSWSAFVDFVEVDLDARKRRLPGDAAFPLDRRFFVVE